MNISTERCKQTCSNTLILYNTLSFIEFQIEDAVTKPKLLNGATSSVSNTPKNRNTAGLTDDHIYNWANELRPSMRKLRQGMDSLCKTARLICR